MSKMRLFKEDEDKKPSEITQEEWDSGDYSLVSIDDETPMAWDAGIVIEGDNLKIEGSLVGGGAAHPDEAGVCTIVVSKRLADELYEVIRV